MSEYFNSFDSNMYHENQNTGMGDENNGLHTEVPEADQERKNIPAEPDAPQRGSAQSH